MGSGWSTISSSTNHSSAQDATPTTAGRDKTLVSNSTPSRKRRRSGNDATEELSSTTGRRPKKRRGVPSTRIGVWSSEILYSAWVSFADSASRYCAKLFLYAAEVAAKAAKPGELVEEEDFFNGIIQSLDSFQSTDLDILRRGWRVLCACNVDHDMETAQLLFGEPPTLRSDLWVVLKAMKGHPHKIQVQLLGFRAIRTLMDASEEEWDVLIDKGAVAVFIQSMRMHSNDVVIQGLGISFLSMLVQESHSMSRDQVVTTVQVIIQAMRNFRDDPRLVHTACFALHRLGFSQQVRDVISSLNGGELFLEAIKNHMDDSGVVDVCLSSLGKLSDSWQWNWITAAPLLLNALRRWSGSAVIQGHGLVLLIRAIEHMPATSIDDAITHAVQVMKNFSSIPTLQFVACAQLREILERSPSAQVRQRVLDEGAMECIVKALMNHPNTFGLQPMALLSIMNIWDRQTPLEMAATTAFGGNEIAIAMITGVHLEVVNRAGH